MRARRGPKSLCRVDRVTGKSAEGHTYGNDDSEYEEFINTCGKSCYIADTFDRENEDKCTDCFA